MRTLVSYLNEKTPQDLRVIAELWEASLTDRLYTGNTFQLAQEMQSEFLQRRLLEKLEENDLKLMAWFTRQPAPTPTLEELVRAMNSVDVPSQVKRLRQFGLLYEDRVKEVSSEGSVTPAPPSRRGWGELYSRNLNLTTPGKKAVFVLPRELAHPFHRLVNEKLNSTHPVGGVKISHLPLQQLVERLEPELLEGLAELWGIVALQGQANHQEMAAELTRSLSDKTLQAKVLGELPEDSQELFEQIKHQGGRTTISTLRKEFVTLKRLARNIRPLTERLLVWEAFEEGESVVFIPPEIAAPKANAAGRSTIELQTVAHPANATTFPPYALAWDSLTFLNYIGQNEVALTNQRYIPKRHTKKLLTQLWLNEETDEAWRFDFLTSLAQRLELYTVETYSGRLMPGPGLDNWLRLDFYEQTRRFFELWNSTVYYNGPVSYPYYYNSSTAILKSQQTIMGWLADCTPGTWYSLASLLHKVQRENPFFIRPRRELLNQFGLQRVDEFSRMWSRIEGEIIRRTFGTVLDWLGIVKVGRDEQGRVDSFTLTELGAELAGVPDAPRQTLPAVDKPLLVQPNLEIMLFAPQVDTIWTLLKFTTLKKLDQVSLYSLDRASVLRGLETGMTSSVILEWLAARNPQPLPQNVAVSVQDWSKGFRRVMVERTTLLEVEDPAVLDELLQSKQYAEFFVRRLSPTAAVVRLPEPKDPNPYLRDNRNDPLKTFKTKLKGGGFFAT